MCQGNLETSSLQAI